jgi:hypothetical protein
LSPLWKRRSVDARGLDRLVGLCVDHPIGALAIDVHEVPLFSLGVQHLPRDLYPLANVAVAFIASVDAYQKAKQLVGHVFRTNTARLDHSDNLFSKLHRRLI